jgi:putative phosphoethanolamine transferase yhbX
MFSKKSVFIYIIIGWLLYVVGFLSSYPYLLEFERNTVSMVDTARNIAEYSLMFLSLLCFCIVFLRKNKFLRVIAYLLLLLLSLNFMLSASCFFIYKQGFNVGMTLSIIETNVSESLSMVKTLVLPIITTIVFYSILLLIFIGGSRILDKNKKNSKFLKFFSFLWIILPALFFIKHKYISNKAGGLMVKNAIYHYSDFIAAQVLKKNLDETINTKVSYNLIPTGEQPVENIVVLVGESVRKQNMSLYGYQRETTPNEVAERNNMLLYQNAYSPAAITNISVPIVLSNLDISNYKKELRKLSDNVVNTANHLNYNTFWYSTQGGAQGITAIASFAKNKKFLNGYDEAVIPYLKDALKDTSPKKLIVLHINGSHPYACDKYPPKEAVWEGGIDECYDNSIRYTDKIIGQIFELLKDKNSALVYFSDHGQIKENEIYKHGDYKEAVQVPYFVWFSPSIKTDKKGQKIEEPTSITTVYSKVLELMGTKNPKTIDNTGKYLRLDLNTMKYDDLK